MKKVLLLIITVMIFGGCATLTPEQKAEKEAKKAAVNETSEALFLEAKQALEKRDFVVEAERINFKRGRVIYVTPVTNFVSLKDGKAIVQLAFNGRGSGPNGLGGITFEGRASNMKMETDKRGNVTFSMVVQGVNISANVILSMPRGTDKCSVTVSSNFSSNRIDFSGMLYPSDQSNVFKGRSL